MPVQGSSGAKEVPEPQVITLQEAMCDSACGLKGFITGFQLNWDEQLSAGGEVDSAKVDTDSLRPRLVLTQCLFHHIPVPRASHKASPDSRGRN